MVNVVRFRLLTETNEGKWTSAGTLTAPCVPEEITITSSSNIIEVAEGSEPTLIPLGIDKCICKIIGYFQNTIPLTTTFNFIDEISNRELLNSIWNTTDEKVLGKGLEVSSGLVNYPELANRWKISTFQWDRQASELGKYRFTMELSYIFDDPTETKIFDDSTANSMATSIKYYALKDNDTTLYQIYNTDIRKTLADLNTAKFSMPSKVFNNNDVIKIYPSNNTMTSAFHGYVKSSPTKNGTTEYNCNEIGSCIYDIAIRNPRSGLFKPRVMIQNPIGDTYLTIQQITKKILSYFIRHDTFTSFNPGSGIDRAQMSNSTTIPNRNVKLPAQILSGMTIGKAIDNFLENTCGLHVWFNEDSDGLEYGFLRDKLTIQPSTEFIMSTAKVPDDLSADEKTVDVVCVYNQDGSNSAYPTEFATSKSPRIAYYRINTNQTDLTNQMFAQKIYEDNRVDKSSYKVRFPPGTVRFKEGDVFAGLGDQTINPPMPYRSGDDADITQDPSDSVWQIKDVRITDTYTECVVGTSYYSIFDIYKTALNKIDGAPAQTSTITWKSPSIIAKKTS